MLYFLARQTGGKINVLYDFENRESKLFVLGVLNSRLINYYYCKKNETKHLNGGALPFDTESVNIIPIPKVTLEKQKEISLIVEEIIELKRNNVKVSESLENNIDKIIYDMYGLTEAEIKIIEQCV